MLIAAEKQSAAVVLLEPITATSAARQIAHIPEVNCQNQTPDRDLDTHILSRVTGHIADQVNWQPMVHHTRLCISYILGML